MCGARVVPDGLQGAMASMRETLATFFPWLPLHANAVLAGVSIVLTRSDINDSRYATHTEQSKRLSGAEFLAFARTLTWQSPALAAAFHEGSSSHSMRINSGQAVSASAEQEAKKLRHMMSGHMAFNADITSTVHALMSLNEGNQNQLALGNVPQIPALPQMLTHKGLDSAPAGPKSKSEESTPSPHNTAMQPMYAPTELAQALASLASQVSKAHPQGQHPGPSLAEGYAQVKTEDGQVVGKAVLAPSAQDDSLTAASAASTPPTRPAGVGDPHNQPGGPSCKTSAARVVVEGAQKSAAQQGGVVGGVGQWRGAGGLVGSGGGGTEDGSAHNKYCHFCQHIKVKRASSMIACENRGCNRRFCEHCLNTHLMDQSSSLRWRESGIAWYCPICTKSCCCTLRECTKNHRHCKAYRYRRKRAQLAETETAPNAATTASAPTEALTPGMHPHPQAHLQHAQVHAFAHGSYPGTLMAMLMPHGQGLPTPGRPMFLPPHPGLPQHQQPPHLGPPGIFGAARY
jgi:hypothetical protein